MDRSLSEQKKKKQKSKYRIYFVSEQREWTIYQSIRKITFEVLQQHSLSAHHQHELFRSNQ